MEEEGGTQKAVLVLECCVCDQEWDAGSLILSPLSLVLFVLVANLGCSFGHHPHHQRGNVGLEA
jgi:hypothetical protein